MTTSTPLTCRLLTLGCKVNQYETQYVKEVLESNGYVEAVDGQQADLCLINTCTVTSEGDAKSRQMVRRLHQKNPEASIVVMGCYATRDPETVGNLPGVNTVITDKEQLLDDLKPYGVSVKPQGISRFDDHSRAFVKVQDGCLLNCSYCIIPSVRPTMRSRPVQDIVQEVTQLVDSGFQEIVLTGIHLGHYGIDLSKGKPKSEWSRLWHLLEELDQIPGDFRLRLSSLEAAEARDDLIRVMKDHPRICPHLHLCLQSGSDGILRQMKRRYRSSGFLERCRRIQEELDRPAFSTDIIVGFPGETEEDFEKTCQVAREAGFVKIHVFPFSPREGTPAAEMNERLPRSVVNERRLRLEEIERQSRSQYLDSLLETTLDVLVENADPERPGFVKGTSCRYVSVTFRGHLPALEGKRVPVRALHVEKERLFGEPLLSEENNSPPMKTPTFSASRLALPVLG